MPAFVPLKWKAVPNLFVFVDDHALYRRGDR